MRFPYAFLCQRCGHLGANHRLALDGDLRKGPYRCKNCACEIDQLAPMTELTKKQFDAWRAAHPEAAEID